MASNRPRQYTEKELELITNLQLSAQEIGLKISVHPHTVYRYRKQLGLKAKPGAKPNKPVYKRRKRETRTCIAKDCNIEFEVNQASKRKYCGPRCQMLTNNPSYKGMPRPKRNPNVPEYTKYMRRVRKLTEENYHANIDIINPNRYKRTLCGVKNGWQLDHIQPVKECFEKGISEEQAAAIENLRMLPWKENLMRQYV